MKYGIQSKTNNKAFKLESLCSLFKALSDPNRLGIVNFFCQCGPSGCTTPTRASVREVASCCDVDMSVVSRHLACLKDCGVLDSQKSGKEVFYSLNAGSIATLLRAMADMIEGVNAQTPNETATQPKGEIP